MQIICAFMYAVNQSATVYAVNKSESIFAVNSSAFVYDVNQNASLYVFTWVRQCTLSWYWWWVERPPSDREEISEPRTQRPRLLLQTRPFPRRKKLNLKKKTFLLSFVSYSVISKFFDDIDIRFDNFCCNEYNLFFL